jgi:hypothetical protein
MSAAAPRKHRAAWLRSPNRLVIARVSRYLGALAVLATGVTHIEQYSVYSYSTVPTIGTLFLLNFIAAIVIAAGLTARLERVAGRYTDPLSALAAVGGIGFYKTNLAAAADMQAVGSTGPSDTGPEVAERAL